MNRYHDAMEHCAPPPELEARLRPSYQQSPNHISTPPSSAPGALSGRPCWLR